jgi:hypothetical protein
MACTGARHTPSPASNPATLKSNMSISPNKLTMPPVAIECVRNIRREAQASFWEACHVAKQNVTKLNCIWFLGVY